MIVVGINPETGEPIRKVTPEESLLLAAMNKAWVDIQPHFPDDIRKSAYDWFLSNDRRCYFSFAGICARLQLPRESILKEAAKIYKKKGHSLTRKGGRDKRVSSGGITLFDGALVVETL